MSDILLIFTKNPQLGRVKTRLAQTMGDGAALRIYLLLLEHTRAVAAAVSCARRVYYSDYIPSSDEWTPPHFSRHLQKGDDLGARMSESFKEAFESGAGKAVIIGSDCYALSAGIVEQAFGALDTHDFVLGPSTDGGYYLLGMRGAAPGVFAGIPWSTPVVLARTVEKIAALNGSLAFLPELSDIDTEADWQKAVGGTSGKTTTWKFP